jgi:hypothetical protein
MGYLTAVSPLVQARAALWRERMRRPVFVSVLLVVLGFGGALGGGALIGEWCLGLVLIAESALVVYVGFQRDDGRGPVDMDRPHTVKDVLLREARRP